MATILGTDRENALRIGFNAADWPVIVEYDTYLDILSDWTVLPIERDGQCIGAFFRSPDGEVHGAILPEWRGRWATRGLLRKMFSGENIKTCISDGHDFMYCVLDRLGFRQNDDGMLYLERRKKWL